MYKYKNTYAGYTIIINKSNCYGYHNKPYFIHQNHI